MPERADGLTIRDASPDDAPTLASLLGELGYPSDAEQVRARMARVATGQPATDALFVAVSSDSGDVVGVIALHRFPTIEYDADVSLITALVVAERARGLGVGRRLVDRVVETARAWGSRRLVVTTHVRRAGAHAFYERIGFELTGRRYVRTL